MKLALVRACTRSACFELQNNTCYTAPAPFRVQLNGQTVLEACYRYPGLCHRGGKLFCRCFPLWPGE